jgi:hypothetical protein
MQPYTIFMSDSVYEISNYVQWLGSLLIAALVFYRFPTRTLAITIVGIYGLASFTFQLLQSGSAWLTGSLEYLNPIGDIYVLCETLLLLLLFRAASTQPWTKKQFAYVAVGYVVVYILLQTFGVHSSRSVIRTVRDLLLIFSAIVYFFQTMKELPSSNLLRLPMFWFAAGILFFFSCTFILSLTMDYIASALADDFSYYWSFRNFLRAFFCALLCIGIGQARKNTLV